MFSDVKADIFVYDQYIELAAKYKKEDEDIIDSIENPNNIDWIQIGPEVRAGFIKKLEDELQQV